MKIFYKNLLSILTLFIFSTFSVSLFSQTSTVKNIEPVLSHDNNYITTSSHNIFLGGGITNRLSSEAFDTLQIFADMDAREIQLAVERSITDYAIGTNRRHLSGYNFDIKVYDIRWDDDFDHSNDSTGIYIYVDRIFINVIPTGNALFRFNNMLNISHLYQDMSEKEVRKQIAMSMANLDINNLVYDNFDVSLDYLNSPSLSITIDRQPISYNFTGNARNALEGLVITNLYKDMTNDEIVSHINTAIDNSNTLWFRHDAVTLRVLDEHTSLVSLEFNHITRDIELSGDFFYYYTLISEDFSLNMTMTDDDIRKQVKNTIKDYYVNIAHLEDIMILFSDTIRLNVVFRRTRINIDLNLESDNIFNNDFEIPYDIIGDNVNYNNGIFYIDARFGLSLNYVLNSIEIYSMAHDNPVFIYTNRTIDTSVIDDVKVNWGSLRLFDIKLTIWTDNEDLRDLFKQEDLTRVNYNHTGSIIVELQRPFGITPQYFINNMIEELNEQTDEILHVAIMDTTLLVLEHIEDDGGVVQRLREVNPEGILITDIVGYLAIDFKYLDLTFEMDMGNERESITMSVRVHELIYPLLTYFSQAFYYMNPGYAIEGWLLYRVNPDGSLLLIGSPTENTLMMSSNMLLRAIYRPLVDYTLTIVFDEGIEVEVSISGISHIILGNIFTLQIFENSYVMNTLNNLIIIRRGFEFKYFILDGNILDNDFRMPQHNVYLYVMWEEVTRFIIVELNIPNNATLPPNFNVPNMFEVSYGTRLEDAMGEFFILNNLFTHYFKGFIFRSWLGGEVFEGYYMPEFDLVAEATWVARYFDVWLLGNGGTINNSNNQLLSIPFGVNLLEAIGNEFDFTTDFHRLGFNFLFFQYGNSIIPTDMTMPSHPIDILLIWTEIQYEIVFVLDGGILPGFNGNDTVTIFMTYERFINDFLYIVIPLKDGYEFIGWLYNDHLVDHNTTFPSFISYIRLYALWEELELSNLSITITSSRGANIFNDSSYIIFNNIENVVTQQDFINLLRDLARAYNAVDNTANSIFLGVSLRYVRGINLLDFTYNNVEILSNNSINRVIDGHIHLYTVEAHYSIYVSDNVQIRPNEDGELTGIILAPGGSHSLGDVVLPTYVQGVPVTEIADNSFAWRNVTSLVLPRYIEVIHPNAFAGIGASELVIEDLPNLRTIGNQAFTNAAATSITLRNLPSLVSIGNGSFAQWTANRTITLDNLPNINHMGIEAFGNNPHTFNLRNINPYATFQSGVVPGWHVSRINLLGDWSITPIWWPNRTAIWGNARFFNDIGTDVTSLPRPQ